MSPHRQQCTFFPSLEISRSSCVGSEIIAAVTGGASGVKACRFCRSSTVRCLQARNGNYPIDGRLREVFDFIRSGKLACGDAQAHSDFVAIVEQLCNNGYGQNGDFYLLLHDFPDYCRAQQVVDETYKNVEKWTTLSIKVSREPGIKVEVFAFSDSFQDSKSLGSADGRASIYMCRCIDFSVRFRRLSWSSRQTR